MKIELSNITFMSDKFSTPFNADLHEGINCICCRDQMILHLLYLYLTASVKPNHGHVRFLNYDVCTLGEAYKNHLSYFSRYPLYPDTFSLYHYLTYTSLLQRLSPDAAKRKAEFLIQEMGLTSNRNSCLAALSSDVLNKINLYQTLLSEAPIFILENKFLPDPDSSNYRRMLSILSEASDSKIIIILTKKEDPLPDLPHKTYVI